MIKSTLDSIEGYGFGRVIGNPLQPPSVRIDSIARRLGSVKVLRSARSRCLKVGNPHQAESRVSDLILDGAAVYRCDYRLALSSLQTEILPSHYCPKGQEGTNLEIATQLQAGAEPKCISYASAPGNGVSGSISMTCSPHSVLAMPGQRPALGSSPGRMARVQCVQPMLG